MMMILDTLNYVCTYIYVHEHHFVFIHIMKFVNVPTKVYYNNIFIKFRKSR